MDWLAYLAEEEESEREATEKLWGVVRQMKEQQKVCEEMGHPGARLSHKTELAWSFGDFSGKEFYCPNCLKIYSVPFEPGEREELMRRRDEMWYKRIC